ncbi:hypothetical protein H4219_005152 [Mycoemilia scoparia]|uniref:Uncharacterized protein n=1 Tax=Mycoemilia scoparia TaxID=417184 RepID=A0A9W8DKC3_9FUNG|nr:hypothetical protein H4219_005152 [Mycoemilia scoparia]
MNTDNIAIMTSAEDFEDVVLDVLDSIVIIAKTQIIQQSDLHTCFNYWLNASRCQAQISKRAEIILKYDEHMAASSASMGVDHNEEDGGHGTNALGTINRHIQANLSEYRQYIWGKATIYLNGNAKTIGYNYDDVQAISQIITFTPTQVTTKFDLFCTKIQDDMAKYDQYQDYAKSGEEFADYLLRIAKYACVTAAYISICCIAIATYKKEGADACRALINSIKVNPILMELENFQYGTPAVLTDF